MKTKIICMASAKGGSGKTVLTATFATFLTALGKRVLMIDTDAATNGLTLMFLKEAMLQAEIAWSERRHPRGIYEAPSETARPEIIKLPTGVHLIPATYSFKNTESVSVEQFEESLQKILQLAGNDYDFIFLDAQAGSDSFAQVVVGQRYSDQVVIVSEYDPLSAAGVERLKGLFREDLTFVRTWILLNKMLPDFVQSFSDFMEVARYASPIPWDADVVRAYARRRLALDLERGNEFTLAVVQTLRSILGDEIGADLDSWLTTRTAALREPLEVLYKDTERELESLLRERTHIRWNTANRSKWRWTMMAGASLLAVSAAWLFISDRFNFKLSWASVVLELVGSALFVYGFIRRRWSGPSIEEEVSQAKIERRIGAVQESLNKLEALRTADVKTLLKNRM